MIMTIIVFVIVVVIFFSTHTPWHDAHNFLQSVLSAKEHIHYSVEHGMRCQSVWHKGRLQSTEYVRDISLLPAQVRSTTLHLPHTEVLITPAFKQILMISALFHQTAWERNSSGTEMRCVFSRDKAERPHNCGGRFSVRLNNLVPCIPCRTRSPLFF